MGAGAGVSRVAVEVVILVVGIALTLLVIGPTFGLFSWSPTVYFPYSGLQAMDGFISYRNSTHAAVSLTIRNAGTEPLGAVGSSTPGDVPGNWTFFADHRRCIMFPRGWPFIYQICGAGLPNCVINDGALSSGEVWNFVIICPGDNMDKKSSLQIEIYGPKGVRAALKVEVGRGG